MIRWLNQDVNGGSVTVPYCLVMRLDNKSINNHPTILAFIDVVQMSNSSDPDMSPQMDIVGDFDLDLHDFLERQVEGIRNSVHGSNKRIRDEISVFEVATMNDHDPTLEASMTPTIQVGSVGCLLRQCIMFLLIIELSFGYAKRL